MKKLLYAFVLLLGITAHSQILQFGVKGGFNTSTLSGSGDISSLSGFHAGVFATVNLVVIDVVPELVYSTQGASIGNQDIKLNYFNVPVMARLNLLKILYVEAGPQFGFLVGADDGTPNSKDNYESTDFAVGVGAGVELLNTFSLGLRYNIGTTDVTKAPGDNSNNVFQVGLAYKF